jgi:acetylornithine/succinyldiaminopimelate/putrescine aminotransferase
VKATGLSEIQALEERYLMRTYRRAPVEFVRGEGAVLWDGEGREYLDFLAGISVCSVGHCNTDVVEAVREQAGRLIHTSNLFYTEPMVRLAERLSRSSLGGRVFFSNSGTEANECAIKIARKHAHRRGVERPEIVSFERDFHGRTYGSLSATPGLAADAALRRVRELGSQLREGLTGIDGVAEVRGRGLMIGVGLRDGIDAAAVGADLLERGLIVNVPRPDTVRLLPPLTVDSSQVERAVALLAESLLSYSSR